MTSHTDNDNQHHHHHGGDHHDAQQHRAFVAVSAITIVVNDPTDSLAAIERQRALHGETSMSPTAVRSKRTEKPITISLVDACIEVLHLVLPIIATSFLSFGINRTFCMMVIGQTLTVRDITIFGVGISLYNVAGVAFPIGFSCACDTLCSQAFGREPNSAASGQYLQTGMVLNVLICCPAMLLFFFSEPVLAMIFEASLAHDLRTFLIFAIPLMFCQSLNITVARALQAQKRADIPTFASVSGTVVFVIIALLVVPKHGVFSAPLCLAVANMVPIIVTFVYCFYFDGPVIVAETSTKSGEHDATQLSTANRKPHIREDGNIIAKVPVWNPLNFEYWKMICSTERVKEFSAIGFQSALGIASEWIALEFVVLIGAQLGNDAALAALNIDWITNALLFCVPLSTSVGSSAFVGNHLGRNEPLRASFYAQVVQLVCMGLLMINSFFLTVAGTWWNSLFSNDPLTLQFVNASLSSLIFFHNCQGWHISLQGIFRGCGWQDYCAKIVVVSLWGIGLPFSYMFGIRDMMQNWFGIGGFGGLGGIFYGFAVGFIVEIGLLLYGCTLLPWKELALEASKEAAEEESESSSQVKK